MLLAIDIGNTNITIGVFSHSEKMLASWRIGTDYNKTVDEFEVLMNSLMYKSDINRMEIEESIISSVVPTVTDIFIQLCARITGEKPIVVGPGVKTGMPIKYDNPREVGADRIANGIAAYEMYGGPAIISDFGTATTYDVISKSGDYLGGTISPGIEISLDALFRKTAKLPKVELRKVEKAIGKNTSASMQSGMMCSVLGGISYTINAIQEELGEPANVIATGGLAETIGMQAEEINFINTELTLVGLKIINKRNR